MTAGIPEPGKFLVCNDYKGRPWLARLTKMVGVWLGKLCSWLGSVSIGERGSWSAGKERGGETFVLGAWVNGVPWSSVGSRLWLGHLNCGCGLEIEIFGTLCLE